MKKLGWLLWGVLLGFVGAHFMNRHPEGRRFFDRLNRGVAEFNHAFGKGYHDAEAREDEAEAGSAGASSAPPA